MTEQEFKDKLNPEQYRIMRERGTEMPYISKYWNHDEHGVYFCAACGCKLFSSLAKFDAEDGWPAFTNPINEKDVELKGGGEVLCQKCGSHLGELVGGEKEKRYRINSVCLDFKTLDIELGEDEEKEHGDEEESEKQKSKNTKTQSANSLARSATLVIAGIVVGASAAAAFASMLCESPAPIPLIETPVTTSTALPTDPIPTPPETPQAQTPSVITPTSPKGKATSTGVVPRTAPAAPSPTVATSSSAMSEPPKTETPAASSTTIAVEPPLSDGSAIGGTTPDPGTGSTP